MDKKKVIVICGPTASGKTALGIEVANLINGEIISADSMQIYKDMDIGSAKPTVDERAQAVHHFVDFVDPDIRYSVADFKNDAEIKIKDIIFRNKVPIIVGGTGLYVNSLIYNIHYQDVEVDLDYRRFLENVSIEKLYEMANKIDPDALNKISLTDRKRISRIIEIYHSTGKTKTELEKESRHELEYDYKVFVLNMDREKLYERINLRVDLMINAGLVDEVKKLINKYNDFPTAMQGLGYKEIVQYLNGNCSLDEAVDKIKIETRRYAKRQLTWFRSYKNVVWIESGDLKNVELIAGSLK